MSDKIPIFRIAPAPRERQNKRCPLNCFLKGMTQQSFLHQKGCSPATVALKDSQGLSTHIGSATKKKKKKKKSSFFIAFRDSVASPPNPSMGPILEETKAPGQSDTVTKSSSAMLKIWHSPECGAHPSWFARESTGP